MVGISSVVKVSDTNIAVSDRTSPRFFYVCASFIFLAPLLTACGVTGNTLKKAGTDPALVTGSVTSEAPPDPDRLSDEATIRNAVSSANLDMIGPQPLSWANKDTGSRGAVSHIIEAKREGSLCRTFETSRESFEGIAMFAGKACLKDNGEWSMLNFDSL